MFFEKALELMLGGITGLTINQLAKNLAKALSRKGAVNFSKERLRGKYEKIVFPLPYENIAECLVLTESDFIEILRVREGSNSKDLEKELKTKLLNRVSGWKKRRLNDRIFSQMVDDFYLEYFNYFSTVDPEFATFQTLGLSNQILSCVVEIKKIVENKDDKSIETLNLGEESSLAKDVVLFLMSINVHFDIIEESYNHSDILIVDPQSYFSTVYSVCICNNEVNESFVDSALDRTKRSDHQEINIIVSKKVTQSLVEYAKRRRVKAIAMENFRKIFLKQGIGEKFLIGKLASQALTKMLNISEVYIPPDAVPCYPEDNMEEKFISVRKPAELLVEEFLIDDKQKVLIVLGGYGTGKSAFCGHLHYKYSSTNTNFFPVYIPLKTLDDANELVDIIEKGGRIAESISRVKNKLFVILDGLDELPSAMSIKEKRLNMLRLIKAANRVNKMVITVRTSYFSGLKDFWNFFTRENDDKMWDKLASHINSEGARPRVSAIILREFDTDQIHEYVKQFGVVRGKPDDYKRVFFEKMVKVDPEHIYHFLARNPLYLFLIVNCEPWEGNIATCFGHVLENFINYWLERDIEKGPSRWTLSIDDRKDFISGIAFWMFKNGKKHITFNEFNEFVQKWFESDINKVNSIALDLQTTGVFACVGGLLYFSLPPFMDYLVAKKVLRDKINALPIPTPSQSKIMLGLVETNNFIWGDHPTECTEVDPVAFDPRGILYGKTEWHWPIVNLAKNAMFRKIFHTSMNKLTNVTENSIHLRFSKEGKGLHARAAAKFINLSVKMDQDIYIRFRGEVVSGKSILGLLMLAVHRGATIEIYSDSCSNIRIEGLLKELGAVPEPDRMGYWFWLEN